MHYGFEKEELDEKSIELLIEKGKKARGDILTMTTLAGSGHPGGSMSSIDIYLMLYYCANVFPDKLEDFERDRIIASHGHTSPGLYSALGCFGFINMDEAVATFRKAGSIFEGHIERCVPGVEWTSGNLGQGLSAGCGFALASKVTGENFNVFVMMGDGEQQKGQLSEARRFAKKYKLNNLTAIVDFNKLQISGSTDSVMPQNIAENYSSDGWSVIEIDGHDHQEIYKALKKGINDNAPTVIIAHTHMGKGVSFMEDKAEYHGKALTYEEYKKAIEELNVLDTFEKYKKMRLEFALPPEIHIPSIKVNIENTVSKTYAADVKTDNRSAFGAALKDIALANDKNSLPMAVFDCDLATSVKTDGYASVRGDSFFQGGIQEHNTATIAGALSTQGILTFFADFGVFGINETYNQHRLNDINETNLKLVCTHVGLDVGEDGKTHQAIDYISLMSNLYGYKIIIPADPNQTYKAVCYSAKEFGNFFIGMGRSKLPTIMKEDGTPYFGDGYIFEYGKADLIRKGKDATIITIGGMLFRALKAREILKSKGYDVSVLHISTPVAIDMEALSLACKTGIIVTYEDHNIKTGLGSLIANKILESGLKVKFKKLGVTRYGDSGSPDDLFKMMGLSDESLAKTVENLIKDK